MYLKLFFLKIDTVLVAFAPNKKSEREKEALAGSGSEAGVTVNQSAYEWRPFFIDIDINIYRTETVNIYTIYKKEFCFEKNRKIVHLLFDQTDQFIVVGQIEI